ncbi:hypothetical protein [Mesorhizobium japonicum]
MANETADTMTVNMKAMTSTILPGDHRFHNKSAAITTISAV